MLLLLAVPAAPSKRSPLTLAKARCELRTESSENELQETPTPFMCCVITHSRGGSAVPQGLAIKNFFFSLTGSVRYGVPLHLTWNWPLPSKRVLSSQVSMRFPWPISRIVGMTEKKDPRWFGVLESGTGPETEELNRPDEVSRLPVPVQRSG